MVSSAFECVLYAKLHTGFEVLHVLAGYLCYLKKAHATLIVDESTTLRIHMLEALLVG